MTNYRLEMCEECDKPQFKVCFDCGRPITLRGESPLTGEKTYGCSAMNFHLLIFTKTHEEIEQELHFI